MNEAIIALDVGGTSIKAGLVDRGLNLVHEQYASYPMEAQRDAEAILDRIAEIITDEWVLADQENRSVQGIGFCFPGPFDYENGISYMKNLGKYDALYGLPLIPGLRKRLSAGGRMENPEQLPIWFENDAVLFACGEFHKGMGQGCGRLLCITLGTGCGSTFLEQGRVVRGEYGVPENGMIFDQPFKEGTVDDSISRRGIMKLASTFGFDADVLDVRELAQMAGAGNRKAAEVFYRFGVELGEVLNPFILPFKPDAILLGGQISGGFELFREGLRSRLSSPEPEFRLSRSLSKSALIGAGSMFFDSNEMNSDRVR